MFYEIFKGVHGLTKKDEKQQTYTQLTIVFYVIQC